MQWDKMSPNVFESHRTVMYNNTPCSANGSAAERCSAGSWFEPGRGRTLASPCWCRFSVWAMPPFLLRCACDTHTMERILEAPPSIIPMPPYAQERAATMSSHRTQRGLWRTKQRRPPCCNWQEPWRSGQHRAWNRARQGSWQAERHNFPGCTQRGLPRTGQCQPSICVQQGSWQAEQHGLVIDGAAKQSASGWRNGTPAL